MAQSLARAARPRQFRKFLRAVYEVADLRQEIYANVYSCARALPINAKAFLFKCTRLGRDG
jgi:hypothetical protein